MKTTALMFAVLLAAGCGVSGTDVCKKACRKTVSCGGGTTQQIAECERACDSNPVDYSACTNTGAILGCANDCLDVKDCNDYGKCVTGCPKCVTEGVPPDMKPAQTNNNPDMTTMTGDYCLALCEKVEACGGNQCMPAQFKQNTCALFGTDPSPCVKDCVTTCSAPTAPCSSTNDVITCIQNCAGGCGA